MNETPEQKVARGWGLHPDEAKPRAETWLHERRNWEEEVLRLRESVTALTVERDAARELLRRACCEQMAQYLDKAGLRSDELFDDGFVKAWLGDATP